MAHDITMTQIAGATHHYQALVDVDPANLEPTVDLFHFIDADGNTAKFGVPLQTVDGILQDPELEACIEAEFQALSSSVRWCKFKKDSLKTILSPSGHIIDVFIKLKITTVAPIVEPEAIDMKFEYLHTDMR
jgi:hypothetical protein